MQKLNFVSSRGESGERLSGMLLSKKNNVESCPLVLADKMGKFGMEKDTRRDTSVYGEIFVIIRLGLLWLQ